jgi:hypothetical protein
MPPLGRHRGPTTKAFANRQSTVVSGQEFEALISSSHIFQCVCKLNERTLQRHKSTGLQILFRVEKLGWDATSGRQAQKPWVAHL